MSSSGVRLEVPNGISEPKSFIWTFHWRDTLQSYVSYAFLEAAALIKSYFELKSG